MANKNLNCSSGGGAVYGMGMIGALVYFVQQASTLSEGFVGVLKALVWPGLLVYKLFGYLGM